MVNDDNHDVGADTFLDIAEEIEPGSEPTHCAPPQKEMLHPGQSQKRKDR